MSDGMQTKQRFISFFYKEWQGVQSPASKYRAQALRATRTSSNDSMSLASNPHKQKWKPETAGEGKRSNGESEWRLWGLWPQIMTRGVPVFLTGIVIVCGPSAAPDASLSPPDRAALVLISAGIATVSAHAPSAKKPK